MFKKIAFVSLSAFFLAGCSQPSTDLSTTTDPMSQTKAKASSLTDVSVWTTPTTLQGGEGLSFMLPEALTYAGGGDTDMSSASWITEKETGDEYFTLKSYTLLKCESGNDCGLDTLVPGTPEEVVENLIQNPPDGCTTSGEIAVGNVKGQSFTCQSPAVDLVFFYGSKGAYSASNDLLVLLGDKELSDSLFQNFLSTITVE